jgi:hypothetical protein
MPFVGNWTDAAMNFVATTGKNNVDNVEQVYLATPTQTGTYTITVSRDGALTTSSQVYSLVVTGSENVEANPPPVVNITAPTNGATVLPGSPVTITATATDLAVGGQPGEVTKVEFFDGSIPLGEDTSAPYEFSWVNAASGAHVITAKATDNEGASTISSAVNVNVLIGSGAPTITSFSSTNGVAGDSVVISGDNLGIASSVRFGALAATFTANSSSQITAVVPANAVTAPITVSNTYGSVTTSSNFTIIPIVFREDFASLTTGNNTTTTGSSTVWAGNINFPTGVNDYQAGGAVKLGTSWLAGSITSRAINLAGNGGAFTVSLKVKGWSTREGDIKVTAGAQTQTVTYTATMSGDFETKTLRFTGGTSATTIKIETTAKRAFLDDVAVYAEAPSSPPVITSPSTAGGIVGQAFSYQITASNAPTSYGATNLPAWASINTTNGLISGPNPTAGTNVVTISASNSVGVGSTNLTITILPSGGGGTTSTIFSENMGAPTANTLIAVNTFQNSGTLSFAGTGDVRTSTPSSGYTGASGGGNVFITQTANLFFEISGINTTGYSNLTLSFGHHKNTIAGSNELAVEFSADGSNYSPLSYSRPTGSGTATWLLVTPTGTIPATANLRIRFRQTSTSTQFRIDDVKLTGVADTLSPSISATGSLFAVNTVYGTASPSPASFKVSGANLVAGIRVAPPVGFEVSAGNANSFAGEGTSILVGSGGTLAETTIYVRLAADTDVNTYSGNIVCSSDGASDVIVATAASTVTPKIVSVSADVLRKTYGNVDPSEFTYSASYNAPFSGALTRDPGEDVGSYRIRQGSLTAGANFSISLIEVDFSILKKRLSITADNRTKAFGQTLTLGAGQTGFTTSEMVGTDKIDTVTITASGGTEANDPAGTYDLTPSAPVGQNFATGNYDIYYTLGTLTVNQGSAASPTFESWAGQGVELTPELLMKYAIGGAASSSATGQLPVVGMDGSNLTLTAIVRKDSTLTIVGQAVTNLEDYGTPASVNSLTGTSEGVSQIGVPTDCERRIFRSTLTGSKSFLRLSVQKQ